MDCQQRDHKAVAELPGAGKRGSMRRRLRLGHQCHARFKQDVAVDEPIEF